MKFALCLTKHRLLRLDSDDWLVLFDCVSPSGLSLSGSGFPSPSTTQGGVPAVLCTCHACLCICLQSTVGRVEAQM